MTLLGSAVVTTLAAQDTAAARPADTTLARADSVPAGQNGTRPDTGRQDSVPVDSVPADTVPADSAGADSARADTTAQSPPPPPPQPVDSALAAACGTTGGDPPDLLTVVFRPTSTAGEREAVAREVGGTLVEASEHQAPGAWYLEVPNSAIDKSVADRLITLPPVLEVSATRCPS